MRSFRFFIHDTRFTRPMLAFELVCDETWARRLAKTQLTQSPHHLLVEVREENRVLFSIDRDGGSWVNHGDRLSI